MIGYSKANYVYYPVSISDGDHLSCNADWLSSFLPDIKCGRCNRFSVLPQTVEFKMHKFASRRMLPKLIADTSVSHVYVVSNYLLEALECKAQRKWDTLLGPVYGPKGNLELDHKALFVPEVGALLCDDEFKVEFCANCKAQLNYPSKFERFIRFEDQDEALPLVEIGSLFIREDLCLNIDWSLQKTVRFEGGVSSRFSEK